MIEFDPNGLITALLGVGGVTFIGALVKAYKDMQSGALARDRDTVGALRAQRDDADEGRRKALEERDRALEDRDYYQRWCGRLVFQLERHGIEPALGGGLSPPSQRATAAAERPRRRRPPTSTT